MKKVVILGSTGSIGSNTLEVIESLGKQQFVVEALACSDNLEQLSAQIQRHRPRLVAIADKTKALQLQRRFADIEVWGGAEGVAALAALPDTIVVIAINGTASLLPTITGIKAGNRVALASKEALVSAGQLITDLLKKTHAELLPVDSEHSAIFQCLQMKAHAAKRLILTASGGPFLNHSLEQLQKVTAKEALNHPTWQMGSKITIDSSTLMNKGLEVIEAHWLFKAAADAIEVVIHPQSIIHSLVEFVDHSTLAQLSHPDMRLPIQYALTYPERKPCLQRPLNLLEVGRLDFIKTDTERFICLQLAFEAMKQGKSYCCFLNAANEVVVDRFLKGEIGWFQIGHSLQELLATHNPVELDDLEKILAVEKEAKEQAAAWQPS